MIKEELVREIARRTRQRSVDVSKTVESGMEIIKEVLESGEPVILRGFGTFTVVEKAARQLNKFGTAELVYIPQHVEPAFKPGKELVDRVRKQQK